MKKLIVILLLILSINANAQTEAYTTDGVNRFSKEQLEKESNKLADKYTALFGKEMFVTLKIDETNTVNDSIIHKVTFNISNEKTDVNFATGPLYDLRGKEFPSFDLQTLFGENFNSEQLKGKPTMINFWFTTCPPCLNEMPALNKIAERYKGDFNFIAITFETKDKVKDFLLEHTFNFKHLVNAVEFTNTIGIVAYPMNLFLDKDGIVKYVKGGIPYEKFEGEGMKMGDGDEIIKIIEELK